MCLSSSVAGKEELYFVAPGAVGNVVFSCSGECFQAFASTGENPGNEVKRLSHHYGDRGCEYSVISQRIPKTATEMGLHIAQAPCRLSSRISETLLKPHLELALLKTQAA